jgi:hypothetical protein
MAKPSDKLPFFKQYPGDWLKNKALRSVSHAARGLWMDMLCFMHEGESRGYLDVNGKKPTDEVLARMLGISKPEMVPLLKELREAKVFSTTKDGIIYSEKMVEDESYRVASKKFGKKGGNKQLMQPESELAQSRKSDQNSTMPTDVQPKRTALTVIDNDADKIVWEGKRWFASQLTKKLVSTSADYNQELKRFQSASAEDRIKFAQCLLCL